MATSLVLGPEGVSADEAVSARVTSVWLALAPELLKGSAADGGEEDVTLAMLLMVGLASVSAASAESSLASCTDVTLTCRWASVWDTAVAEQSWPVLPDGRLPLLRD